MSKEKIIVPRFKKELGFETTEARSKLMSKIKSSDTKPELTLRKALWSQGIRYSLHVKKLPGNPDIVINKHKIAIFVDGEFWHGHEWKKRKEKIKSNRAYWIAKIERNMQRDRENTLALENSGYRVLRFWERQIKKELFYCIKTVLNNIKLKE